MHIGENGGVCEEAKIYPKIGKIFFNFLSFFSSPYNKTTHANNNNVMFEEEKKQRKIIKFDYRVVSIINNIGLVKGKFGDIFCIIVCV